MIQGTGGEIHGGCQLSVIATAEGANFICTTDNGALVKAVWNKLKVEGEVEEEDTDGPFVQSVASGHFGPCQDLQRSPFFPDIWLTVGDWRFSLWKEGIDQPIFSSPFQTCKVTCARWSPNRPSVVFIGREDGMMEVWDFSDRSHERLMEHMFTQPIISMEFPKGKGDIGSGHYLGVGDDVGMCHVMKLPRVLTKPSRMEEKQVRGIFDREVARVEYIKRRDEFRQTERTQMESSAGVEDATVVDPAVLEKQLEDDEKTFQKLKEQFDKDMGLNQPEEEEA